MTEAITQSWRRQQLLTSIIFIAAALLLIVQHWYASREQLIKATLVQAEMIGDSAGAALVFDDASTASAIANTSLRYPQVEAVAIYRTDGSLLAANSNASETTPLELMNGAAETEFSLLHLDVVIPAKVDDRVAGSVHLRLGMANFYFAQLQFIGGLVVIVLLTASAYLFSSTRLRKRVANAEQALQHMATHDNLTKLPNRYAFELILQQTLKRHLRDGGRSILLFIDVDGFKKVNDLYGHPCGDKALIMIGEKIRGGIRDSDIVARLGGDEFGAILFDTAHPDDAARIAKHLIDIVASPFIIDGHRLHLGLSIGIANVPEDGSTVLDLQRHADMAMYRAKREGKNTFRQFQETLDDQMLTRHETEARLRLALTRDEFFIEYQPQVDIRNGGIIGAEALLRWRDPQHGLIPPSTFIPIAEETDLILDVGDWVLNRVLDDIRSLRQRDVNLPPIAINLSGRQLNRGNVLRVIQERLATAGLGIDAIEIELTESVLMEHTGDTAILLDAIRNSGLRLSIDDFGTGYSSLAYLKRLPVSKLKIDRAFVARLAETGEDRAIVAAIVSLASSLGLEVLAEGVETEAQATILVASGCHYFQGDLTGRPMDIESFAAKCCTAR